MMLDQAQLAYVLGKPVYVEVDDGKLSSGFCTAYRFDLYH